MINPARSLGVERKHQRASCDCPAEFTWGTINHPATVVIVGMGGCFVHAEVMVPKGEELELRFCMEPSPEPIRCRAQVVWIAARGIRVRGQTCRGFAVEFLRIYPEDRSRVDEYVKRQTRVFRAIGRELEKPAPNTELVKDLFSRVRPGDSLHMNHIRGVSMDELRYFRLRR
jgi:hypothetical protein